MASLWTYKIKAYLVYAAAIALKKRYISYACISCHFQQIRNGLGRLQCQDLVESNSFSLSLGLKSMAII